MNMAVYESIKELADSYAAKLDRKVISRIEEMKRDDISHHLIYRVLGIADNEGELIDLYQNKGRFLYQYAGSFLEEATRICVKERYPCAQFNVKLVNSLGTSPKTFEIDCLVKNLAHEIKWREATTDGDHITKEHTRVIVIKNQGYIPIRVMYYYPNRVQAIRIQETLETLYKGIGGSYYYGDKAWEYIKEYTGIDLLGILERIASSRQ